MKNGTLHYSAEQFNLLLDGRVPSDEAKAMNDHISGCRECRRMWKDLGTIDAALGQVPLLQARPDFTRSVIDRILIAPKPPFVFRLLENASYLFGLLIVLGIMAAAFVVTGVFTNTEIEQTKNVMSTVASSAGESLATSLGTFNSWLVEYLPFAFGKGSMGIAFFAVLVMIMLAAIDHVVGRRVMQK